MSEAARGGWQDVLEDRQLLSTGLVAGNSSANPPFMKVPISSLPSVGEDRNRRLRRVFVVTSGCVSRKLEALRFEAPRDLSGATPTFSSTLPPVWEYCVQRPPGGVSRKPRSSNQAPGPSQRAKLSVSSETRRAWLAQVMMGLQDTMRYLA